MDEYPKIMTVYKRDPATKYRTLLVGTYACPELAYLAGNEWEFTEKVDGTNIRVQVIPGGEAIFGGRTDNAAIPAHLVSALRAKFDPMHERLAEVLPDGAILYGEGYGAKIQKGGGRYRPDQGFVLFDVRVGGWWLQRADVEDVARKLSCDVVPVLGRGRLADMVTRVLEGITSAWGEFPAEGIGARPTTELCTRAGHRIITKLKGRDFTATKATGSPGRVGKKEKQHGTQS